MHLGSVGASVLLIRWLGKAWTLARLLGGTLYVGIDEKACDGEAGVDGKFGVARRRADRILPSAVCVAQAVAHGTKTGDNR